MKTPLDIDFGRAGALGRFGSHGDTGAPAGETDPERGLRFPLTGGGCMMSPEGVIDDAEGTLELAFAPATASPQGVLVQAWGQYPGLVELSGEGVVIHAYHHTFQLLVRWAADAEYRLRLSWHHELGLTLVLTGPDGVEQTLRRRCRWQAFRQAFVPFSIGGSASRPRYRQWSGSFAGWVRRLRVWRIALDPPGPVAAAGPLPEVLELDDPPILPDPLGLVQLPDRLDDLRRTREAAGLDELLSHCRGDLERLTMLTWHVGQLWPHCNYWPWEARRQRDIFWRRGHELVPSIEAGRTGGMCGGFAHAMEELCWSLGYDARRIQVAGHSSFEAYCPELDRWIVCDASHNRNCHLLADRDGAFLGARELIRRFERSEWEEGALEDVRMMVCERENLHEHHAHVEPSPCRCYDRLGLAMDKTAAYGRDAATPLDESEYAWYFRAEDRAWFRADAMACGPRNRLVDELDQLYPSRNRARVRLEWVEPGRVLRVHAEAVGVTFFTAFEARVDDRPWEPAEADRTWTLHPGVNRLSIRTRNALGATGYPWRIALPGAP